MKKHPNLLIVDPIGRHSGMHYYHHSLVRGLRNNYKKIIVASNYRDKESSVKHVFLNFFKGPSILKPLLFLASISYYYLYVLITNRGRSIFFFYGNTWEIILILPLLIRGKIIVDIHDVFSTVTGEPKRNSTLYRSVRFMFLRLVHGAIVHSDRSDQLLDELGYIGIRIRTPHISYDIDDNIDLDKIGKDVVASIKDNSVNVLFFGYIRPSKGIDIVLELNDLLASITPSETINLIIAGNDPKQLVGNYLKGHTIDMKTLACVLRYISDDELKYLFGKTDFVILPYREISQSGVLEMAIRFRKPVITSNLNYFHSILLQYPSFGLSCESFKPEEFIDNIFKLRYMKDKGKLYSSEDLEKYYSDRELSGFLEQMDSFYI